jgi:nucleoside-diphosphate-sugar epimerase
MERLLIIGCGDVAKRALAALTARYEVVALVRDERGAHELDRLGVSVVHGDLDDASSLRGLDADALLHTAPPDDRGAIDSRTRHLVASLPARREMLARHFVYLSTSGVYGDCHGELVDESRPPKPTTHRARRRLDAERVLGEWCATHATTLCVLRVPGIYASDRLPVARIATGAPVLRAEDDVYTNHIHADDLAAAVVSALVRRVAGTFNVCDDTTMKAGDWLDLIADRRGLPRPPRMTREEAASRLTAMQLSFLSESRRLSNRRMKDELGVTLRYPTVHDGVPCAAVSA